MITVIWPWAAALLPLPYLVYRLFPRAPQNNDAALWVPTLSPYQGAAGFHGRPGQRRWQRWLLILTWLFLVLAAARPQWLGEPIELPVSGRDLMLAVDLSGSMRTDDFRLSGHAVDRLTALKTVAGAFIEQRQGDRIGLILFGEKPYIQAPLTFDHATVTQLLNEAVVGLAGNKTAIGDAIGLAVKRLRQDPQAKNVLILLTDGASNSGSLDPLKAAELAAQRGLKIYTIGIGADAVEVGALFFKRTVNPSLDLDEKTLKAIASATGGRYFRARDTAELTEIYQQLDQLEPAEKDTQVYRPYTELYLYPLAAALLMAVILATSRLREVQS
nr:VWA domain-containing protein [uncultured Desulfuromonas sp.]